MSAAGRPPTVNQRVPEVVHHNPKTGATYFRDNSRPHLRQRRPRPTPHQGERINLREEYERLNSRRSGSFNPRHSSVQETSFGGPVYRPSVAGSSTPLLGQAATSGASSLLTKAAVGGTVAGLGLGGLLAGGATLPGSDYIGPGNKINVDAPRHEGDAIAKDHDVNYQNVIEEAVHNNWSFERFEKQIKQYDQRAIKEFASDYKRNNRWQSLVGHLGLRFKQFVEGYVGTLYPRFPGNETSRFTTKRKAQLASIERRPKALRLGTI